MAHRPENEVWVEAKWGQRFKINVLSGCMLIEPQDVEKCPAWATAAASTIGALLLDGHLPRLEAWPDGKWCSIAVRAAITRAFQERRRDCWPFTRKHELDE